MAAVHFVMVTPTVHGHCLACSASTHAGAGRRLARGRPAGLRTSACRTTGGLCNCESAGQGEGRSQHHCRDFHGRFLSFVNPEKQSGRVN
jgi:hypothetical protein